jgi:restriction endonuclease S subunit
MKQQIKDIADIRSGYQFRGRVEPADDANVKVIQIKDIDDGFNICFSDLVSVRMDNPDPHFLKSGDVLFLSRGHRLFATVISEAAPDIIASGYFYVLQPDVDRVRPAFLAWTINQPVFQESLKSLIGGTHMPLISKTNFQDLTITLPSLAVQDQILTLQHYVDHEQELTTSLLNKRRELTQAVARELLTGRLATKDTCDDE